MAQFNIPIANTLEILKSCTKPWIWDVIIVKGTLVGQLVESGISPLETIFNSDVIYEGPSHNMNSGLVDSIHYVTNAAFSPGDADHTLLYNLCKFGWWWLTMSVSVTWRLQPRAVLVCPITCMPFYLFICYINVWSVPSTNMNNSLSKMMCLWQRSLPVLMRIKPALQFS